MSRLDRYKINLELRKQGKYPGIPLFKIYPKLGRYIPSLPREIMLIFFGSTGSGKTQWWKRLALNMCKLHSNGVINTKPLFIVNLLEESLEEFEDSLVSMIYYDMNERDIINGRKSRISKLKLNSYTKERLSDEEFKFVKDKINPIVDKYISEYFSVDDKTYNPYGIYKRIRNISRDIGTHYYVKLVELEAYKKNPTTIKRITYPEYASLTPTLQKQYAWNEYIIGDSELFPIVITDHIELLSNEKGKDKWQTMRDWSFEYGRKQLSKNYKFNIINILQSTVYSEAKTYSFKNEINWEALKPSLADIGGNKVIAQDHHIVLGGFNPSRYASNGEIDGIDLDKTNGKYRSTKLLKNRIGEDQIEMPWYFDGSSAVWKELDLKNLDAFYKLCAT